MDIRSLSHTSLAQVHAAFGRAFSDYEVPFDLPIEQFAEMLTTRDVTFDLSLGCFDGDDLVSFILCGYRQIGGLACAYDGGTGTVAAHRKQGIGTRLVSAWLHALHKRRIDRVVLEVLEHNTAAIDLYKKAGFQVSRAFDCFRGDKAALPNAATTYATTEDMAHYRTLDDRDLMTFTPSWQNARVSVLNVSDRYAYVGLIDGAQTTALQDDADHVMMLSHAHPPRHPHRRRSHCPHPRR